MLARKLFASRADLVAVPVENQTWQRQSAVSNR